MILISIFERTRANCFVYYIPKAKTKDSLYEEQGLLTKALSAWNPLSRLFILTLLICKDSITTQVASLGPKLLLKGIIENMAETQQPYPYTEIVNLKQKAH